MHIIRNFIISTIAVLALASTALAQGGPERQRRGNLNDAAAESFGLTEEQTEQIREIRRERPNRDSDREEMAAWREERMAKIQAVLTDEQKAKVAEVEEARESMRNFAFAAMLGLVDGQRGFGGQRGQQRGGRGFDRGRDGQGRGFAGGRGRGPQGRGNWRGRNRDNRGRSGRDGGRGPQRGR